MSLVRFGGGVTEMRGSIGGVTFTANAAGSVIRRRSSRTDSPSTALGSYRARFAAVHTAWASLSEANRLGWERYALSIQGVRNIGGPTKLNGWNAYLLTCCYNPVGPATGLLTTPPTLLGVAPGISATARWQYGYGFNVVWTLGDGQSWISSDIGLAVLQISQPSPLHQTHPSPHWRTARIVAGKAADPPPVNQVAPNPWQNPWVHLRQWARWRQRDEHGRIGPWTTAEVY